MEVAQQGAGARLRGSLISACECRANDWLHLLCQSQEECGERTWSRLADDLMRAVEGHERAVKMAMEAKSPEAGEGGRSMAAS